MDCPPTPQFCLDFLLWFKTLSAHLAQALQNRDFSQSSKPEDVLRLVYTVHTLQITLLHSGLH